MGHDPPSLEMVDLTVHPVGTIDFRVPATSDPVSMLRGIVGRVARGIGFTYDGIEDFALAIEEAALLLLDTRPAHLSLHLQTHPGGMVAVLITEDAAKSLSVPELRADYRWDVLETLCDSVELQGPGDSLSLAQRVR